MERSSWSVHETFGIPCRAFPSSMYDLGKPCRNSRRLRLGAFSLERRHPFIAVLLALSYPLIRYAEKRRPSPSR
ncbi:hypothetical protein GTCCBUS3UF5_17260 [Geobacillus thermoleovorans CCB_US3_UF5]|uniref:Uncharacterized protein n=4 Tax=Geobacillus thermoleovorans group TaxID=1505648 RepID=A0A2Z3NED0_GEOTH|nr:hypothetical protein GTCCBUS3UF5_17260 [Geobacillus thermoleovorans CCB_US3_UF5]AUI35567.1 hypothetical protein CWI35_02685 [[Bacillus] caldolyticus]AWO76253.1 hypothetical protein C1N76_18280 [Geobacillus thermoleovorans]QCK82767.1 hypothetical protein E5Z46_11305 [Geobacillus kaustophilus NBRC 102445]TRY43552.1 hypothetical protein FOI67_07615 [Geobacillus sp. LEMMJ02]GAD13585.1 hypothetical protein GBL_1802 [Geobacillus kaustophilus GBlys]GAJ59157.1 hypothetical protein B23_2381 [Geobac